VTNKRRVLTQKLWAKQVETSKSGTQRQVRDIKNGGKRKDKRSITKGASRIVHNKEGVESPFGARKDAYQKCRVASHTLQDQGVA